MKGVSAPRKSFKAAPKIDPTLSLTCARALSRVPPVYDPAVVGINGKLNPLALRVDGIDEINLTIPHRIRDLVKVPSLQLAHDRVGCHICIARAIVGAQEVPKGIHSALLYVPVIIILWLARVLVIVVLRSADTRRAGQCRDRGRD